MTDLKTHTIYPRRTLLVTGGLNQGMKMYGPFEDEPQARRWADDHLCPGLHFHCEEMRDVTVEMR